MDHKEIAAKIVRASGFVLMSLSAFHFGGWWAVVLVIGYLFRLVDKQ